MDKQEIKELEEKNPCKAVVKLVEKLLEVEKPDWPELFLKSLEPQFPKEAKALCCLAERLEADVFTDATLYMDDEEDENYVVGKTLYQSKSLLIKFKIVVLTKNSSHQKSFLL